MKTKTLLNNKIVELNDILENSRENEQFLEQIDKLNECLKVFENDDLFIDFDFNEVLDIIDIPNKKIINKELYYIKQVYSIRKKRNFNYPLQVDQENTLLELKSAIQDYISILSQGLSKQDNLTIEKDIVNLKEFNDILNGYSLDKPYSKDMINSLLNNFDINNMSDDDFNELITSIFNSPNFNTNSTITIKIPTFDEIITLFKKYLPASEFDNSNTDSISSILSKRKKELLPFINLKEAEKILEFLSSKGLLTPNNLFDNEAIVKIGSFSRLNNVVDTYNSYLVDDPELQDKYFDDRFSSMWIKKKKSTRDFNIGIKDIIKDNNNNNSNNFIVDIANGPTTESFHEIVDFLNANSMYFKKKIDFKYDDNVNIILSKPEWLIKKNLYLLKMFDFLGDNYIQPSVLYHCDIEKKIHYAIQLGLLNVPKDNASLLGECAIPLYDKFKSSHKQNESIRDYYKRNTSILSHSDEGYYGYLTNYLFTKGQNSFFEDFFSKYKAGEGDPKTIPNNYKKDTSAKTLNGNDITTKNHFIYTHFMIDFSNEINNYFLYDNCLSSNYLSNKTIYDDSTVYFDDSITKDDLIKELDKHHTVHDLINAGDDINPKFNPYIYKFGDKIISRYKVLHNAEILKNTYGKLDQDMLLTSIVHDAFIKEEFFKIIKNDINNLMKGSKTK